MKTLRLNNIIHPQEIFDGGITMLLPGKKTQELVSYGKKIVEDSFGCSIDEISTERFSLNEFVEKSTKSKQTFTECSHTQFLTSEVVKERYLEDCISFMYFDKPRMRIIPNSNFLSSGISYNYKPHRDTWYGGIQGQINHWIAMHNVSPETSFYIAPYYFDKIVKNNSEIFDLDFWDKNFRKEASKNVKQEDRPHPVPLEYFSELEKYYIVLPDNCEIVFSGHQFHGSGTNNTQKVRFSIDFRTFIETDTFTHPSNIDNKCNGSLKNYMIKV